MRTDIFFFIPSISASEYSGTLTPWIKSSSSSFCGGGGLSIDEEEEQNEKMAAAVRSEGPANLAQKLTVSIRGGVVEEWSKQKNSD